MMSPEPDFDVIVVGAGVAGTVTAYLLAQQGLEVVLIERGESAGSKNLSGGIMYCRAMTQVFPNFLTEAPIERRIDRNQMCFMNDDSWFMIDYGDERLHSGGTAVTVLRAHIDAWLAEQCENVGVTVMPGVKVDGLLIENGQVVGVRAGEDELRSRVTVAADGVNSFICRDAGLRPRQKLDQLAVGVKALLKLPDGELESRFGVSDDHGVAMATVGVGAGGGANGAGGFMYTNRETISIGLVLRLDGLVETKKRTIDLFDQFLAHPLIDSYVHGAELVEYGCHLINEGGWDMVGQIVHNGLVVVGDAAGFTLNTGLTVRGMDLATGSAQAAAPAIVQAIKSGDVSAAGLASYTANLDRSFVGQDMKTYAKAPQFLETDRMYNEYGKLLTDVMYRTYGLDTTPRQHLLAAARGALKASGLGLLTVAKDGLKGVRAL
ncbi:MAG: FAD-dependent oxidoreductase [Propionibacteriaceae bacterium]|jgi:electron transfer flavoprotein-quinone oxidoreductase|nr:FAD-dependent oxidoreductase [Propionibacteriaceae bacterium]